MTNNSAFHGTRLDVQHIGQVMEDLVAKAEARTGTTRHQIAPQTVFVSHETYTPARGGSASAEIHALRKIFGDMADRIVIANTKGLTGHAMGTGIEDVVAVKALETGLVPPVANFKEVDPELGSLNLSKGGSYPVEYALHLGAGFGSQISMMLLRWVKTGDGIRRSPDALGYSYRIADAPAWNSWLTSIAGHPGSTLEVLHRTLRIHDQQQATQIAEPSDVRRAVPLPVSVAATPIPATVPKTKVTGATPPVVLAIPAAEVPVMTPVAPLPIASKIGDGVQERVLALVSEKTGYPVHMLDLDLDLEADLGVDTVKQAEVFATIREAYNIPRDGNRKLRDYPTLAHVIRFVYEKRQDLAKVAPAPRKTTAEVATPKAQTPATPEPVRPTVPTVAGDPVKERVLALVVEKTGYPQDMLDLELDLEADLGVDTVKQAEMFAAVREMYHISRDENRKLRDYPTLAHVIRFVYEMRPDLSSELSVSQPVPANAEPVATRKEEADAVSSDSVRPGGNASDPVKESVLALVVEKTGYPKDMLDLDLDLEADLGVDTVKQAEMFAAIRAMYNIPRDEKRKLRDYPTLAHVIRFVYENRPDLATPGSSVAALGSESGTLPADAGTGKEPTFPSSFTADSIKEKVLDIVAEKTGYPKDMLDPELDLEADLGIDTVKQAEMFAAIRASYNIPRDENLKLRDFPTLAHVIRFAQERSAISRNAAKLPEAASKLTPTSPEPTAAAPVKKPRPIAASLDAANRIPRRVPVPFLRPSLTICKPSCVALDHTLRVVIMPDKGGVAAAIEQLLERKGVQVLRIDPTLGVEALIDCLNKWKTDGPVTGVYWLPALDPEGDLRKMEPAEWHEGTRLRLKSLYTTMRVLYEDVSKPGTFFVSATRLGGQHGYDDAGAFAPMGGAVTGFTKTYKRERPDVFVKAVDFGLECAAAEVARLLVDETLRDPGAIEVGYQDGLRWTIGLEEQSATDNQPGLTLDENTVFLVTGAAGEASSQRSRRTWLPPPAAPSICSTWCPNLIPGTRTLADLRPIRKA